jgi:murein DD-endopeptidase MepM/ murein hydrolase activator NlpD
MFTFSGDPVYAVHDGYISRIADPGGRLSCLYIDGNCKVTVYAHIKFKLWIRIKSWWKPAQYVKTGQVIGYVGKVLRDPHLHFEAFNCGKVLLGKTPKELALEIQEWIEEA